MVLHCHILWFYANRGKLKTWNSTAQKSMEIPPQPFPPQPSDVRASVASTKPSHVEATSPRSSCWSQQNGISQPGVFRWPRTGPCLSRAGSPRASWRSCHAFVPPNTQSIQIRNLEVSYTWKEATCQSYPWCGSAEWTHLSVSENGLVTHSVKT